MKKIISLIICAAMLVGIASVPVAAQADKAQWDGHPIVFLQGYSGPQLIKDRGLETEEWVWGLDMDSLIMTVIKNVPQLFYGIVLHMFGNDGYLVNLVDSVAGPILEPISMNDDGTSKYNVTPYPATASEASAADFRAIGKEYLIPEDVIAADIMQTVPDDMFFTFAADWRRGQVYNAEKLDEFIEEVLRLTGKDKVDIYGLSHGGQLGATYLYYYGTKGRVDNAVLNVPAIRGTTIAQSVFDEDGTKFDAATIVRYGTIGSRAEMNLEWLEYIVPAELLNELVSVLLRECMLDRMKKLGSIWDFILPENYEAAKAKWLDPVKNAGIIAASDEMHYNCMANMAQGLKAAQDAGVSISIMSNYGSDIGTTEKINSDFIIDTASSSGSYVLPLGEHFGKDYVQKHTTCTNRTHNHISPSRDVDASCAYLPENTWFIYGQLHGQAWWDPYTRSMLLKLLLTDELRDIYSDPEYPQFEIGQNPKDFVHARFEGETQGFVKQGDGKLIIKNLSEKYAISLTGVTADGCRFSFNRFNRVKPGETIEVTCDKLTDEQLFKLKIDFVQYRITPYHALSRELWFTNTTA